MTQLEQLNHQPSAIVHQEPDQEGRRQKVNPSLDFIQQVSRASHGEPGRGGSREMRTAGAQQRER